MRGLRIRGLCYLLAIAAGLLGLTPATGRAQGPSGGLRPIREKFAGDLTAILVAGIRPEQFPPDAKPPFVGTSNHGRHLAHLRLDAKDGKLKLDVEQVAIEPTVKPNAEMKKLLAEYSRTGKHLT
jgi:hypothetical protein